MVVFAEFKCKMINQPTVVLCAQLKAWWVRQKVCFVVYYVCTTFWAWRVRGLGLALLLTCALEFGQGGGGHVIFMLLTFVELSMVG